MSSIYGLILKTGVGSLELNEMISKDRSYSYYSAKDIIKGKFDLGGEEAISKNSFYSSDYVKNVLKGRFRLGEKAIDESVNLKVYCYEVLRYNHA